MIRQFFTPSVSIETCPADFRLTVLDFKNSLSEQETFSGLRSAMKAKEASSFLHGKLHAQ
jgi:hypothetical protein